MNGKAGLLTRGLAEMMRLAAAGANALTFGGPGRDRGPHRHVRVAVVAQSPARGAACGRADVGRDRGDASGGTAEGAYIIARSALALADRLGVEMPIAREVERALFEGKSVQRCLVDLLSRESKDELADADAWLARLGVSGG